eukprot:gene14313-20296_t
MSTAARSTLTDARTSKQGAGSSLPQATPSMVQVNSSMQHVYSSTQHANRCKNLQTGCRQQPSAGYSEHGASEQQHAACLLQHAACSQMQEPSNRCRQQPSAGYCEHRKCEQQQAACSSLLKATARMGHVNSNIQLVYSSTQHAHRCSNLVHYKIAPNRVQAAAFCRVLRAWGMRTAAFSMSTAARSMLTDARTLKQNGGSSLLQATASMGLVNSSREPSINLSDDLIRDYETKWWEAARKRSPLCCGHRALHFAAATGNVECTKLLVEAGADQNLQDKEGYTPLHMAAGYMHTPSMAKLIELGSDAKLKDNAGRDVVILVDRLRDGMPLNLQTVQRRLGLEEVANVLMDQMYDEVPPGNLLDTVQQRLGLKEVANVLMDQMYDEVRPGYLLDTVQQCLGLKEVANVLMDQMYDEVRPGNLLDVRLRDDGNREFLVQFEDGRDDEWVEERNIAPDVLEDFDTGLEYAKAEAVVDIVQVRTERRFKVKWSDGYPTSWEPEEHVSPELIALFKQENPELFETRVAAANIEEALPELLGTEYMTQAGGAKIEARQAIGASSSSSS